jgi:hypothetical protein
LAQQGNTALASDAALNKLKLQSLDLQNKLLQQKLQPTAGIDKQKLRNELVVYANGPDISPRDKKVYQQLLNDLDTGVAPEDVAANLSKYQMEPVPKPDKEKPGEYKPYTVAGPDGKQNLVLASQVGDKLLTREGQELPPTAVPFEKPTKETYNASEELHKEHPDWTPEQILEATQRPSFPRIAPVNDSKGNTIGWNYFQGEPGGRVTTKFIPANAGGAPLSESGGVIPPKPTATTLTMAQMASSVLPEAKRVTAEIDTLKSQLGPAVGQWNEMMVGKIGVNNPKVAMLQTDLKLLASAIVRTHFGGRGGQEYVAGMENYFRLAQSPEDLKARIASANEWLTTYSGMAGGTQQAAPPARPKGVPDNATWNSDSRTWSIP